MWLPPHPCVVLLIRLHKGARPTVHATAHMMGHVCYTNKDRLMAGMICAGWDRVAGGSLYVLCLLHACARGVREGGLCLFVRACVRCPPVL